MRPAATTGSSSLSYIADKVERRNRRTDRRRHRRRRDRRRQGARPATPAATASPGRSKRASATRALKALVVRVDSPGGSVLASERIRQALLAAKDDKIPVVVSMGNVAASGGYWVATPADFIFAEPSTITGSIGVFGVLPSFQGTLAKLGVGADGIKTTPLSGEPDLLKGPSPEANRLIQAGGRSRSIASSCRSSRSRAASRRRRSTASPRAGCGTAAPPASSGWSTASAGWTRRSPRRPSWPSSADERGVRYLERPQGLPRQFLTSFAAEEPTTTSSEDAFAVFAARPRAASSRRRSAEMRSILTGPTIQARCLECPATMPAPSRTGRLSAPRALAVAVVVTTAAEAGEH